MVIKLGNESHPHGHLVLSLKTLIVIGIESTSLYLVVYLVCLLEAPIQKQLSDWTSCFIYQHTVAPSGYYLLRQPE